MAVTYDAAGTGATGHAQALSWPHTLGAGAQGVLAAVTNYGYALSPTAWASAVSIGAAVNFDAVGTGGHTTASPLTFPHVCGANANGIAVCVAGYDSAAGIGYGSFTWTVTYNGVPLTQVGGVNFNNATASGFVIMFALANPATGSHTVSVGHTGGSGTVGMYVNSVSYSGAGSVRAVATRYGTGAGTVSTGAISSQLGDLVIAAQAAYSTYSPTFSAPSGVSRYNQPTAADGSGTYPTLLIQDAVGVPGSTTLTATAVGAPFPGSGAVDGWGSVAMSIAPAGTLYPLTSLGAVNFNNVPSTNGFVELWALTAPPTGPQTICAAYVIAGDTPYLYGESVSYNGCTYFGPVVANYGATPAVASGSVASAAGSMVVSAQAVYDQTLTLTGSGTSRYNQPGTRTANIATLLIQDVAGAPTVSLTSTASSNTGSTNWATMSTNVVAGTRWTVGATPLAVTATPSAGASFTGIPWTVGASPLSLTVAPTASAVALPLGTPLRYVGRYPDSDGVIAPVSFALADNAATVVTSDWIDSQVAVAAEDLVAGPWIDQQVANYTTQAQVTASLGAYISRSALGVAGGIAQLSASDLIPPAQLPVLVTNSLATVVDAANGGTIFLGSGQTHTVTSQNIGEFVLASVTISNPGYVYKVWPIAYVAGFASGPPSGSRLSGNSNFGLLTVTPPGSTTVYAAGVMTDDTDASGNYYQCVPYGGLGVTPLTQPSFTGSLTLQLSACCWQGNSYTLSGTGLIFYCLILPAIGG